MRPDAKKRRYRRTFTPRDCGRIAFECQSAGHDWFDVLAAILLEPRFMTVNGVQWYPSFGGVTGSPFPSIQFITLQPGESIPTTNITGFASIPGHELAKLAPDRVSKLIQTFSTVAVPVAVAADTVASLYNRVRNFAALVAPDTTSAVDSWIQSSRDRFASAARSQLNRDIDAAIAYADSIRPAATKFANLIGTPFAPIAKAGSSAADFTLDAAAAVQRFITRLRS
jgi:hypothetical protein